ncbi:protein RESTRICTED TEV MOVEMENT 2 [Canna indica]|uniref:Protein RESTRICTED TEV MOVEMENT 2 n=1 Tax=Canna indica TaxID=4628 RepID=A0AAQ3KF97_9LILI|nr:protein RESTRICTED TEV MOVEMENT 2 [Canna indica]
MDARSGTRSYEDFDPSSEWIQDEGFMTLLIYLPGFKKDQLRVQVDSSDNLRTIGERPLDSRRWSRFIKQFKIPDNCNTSGARAKFENETLHVRFPMQPSQKTPRTTTEPQPVSSAPDKMQKEDKKSTEAAGARQEKEKEDIKSQTKERDQARGKGSEPVVEAREKMEKDEKKLQPKEDSTDGKQKVGEERSNGEKKLEQQRSSKKKTDDKSSDEKKTVSTPGSSKPDVGGDRLGEEMERFGVGSFFTGLTPARKILLVNVAVGSLVLLGLGLYFKYKYERK